MALERQARNPGAQRAALEKQGYDGVATVSAEGRASVQWFAERAQRQAGEPEHDGIVRGDAPDALVRRPARRTTPARRSP